METVKETAVQKFRRLHPGYDKRYWRLFRIKHPDYHKKRYALSPEGRKASSQKWNRSIKLEVIEAYGGKCRCCSENEPGFLTIDHIKGGGTRERARLGGNLYARLKRKNWPKDKYQLLCMNCNFAKGKYGRCPHKTKIPR